MSNRYDGEFDFEGRTISYTYVEDDRPIRHNKFGRYVNFFEDGEHLGMYRAYGTVEEMTNISQNDLEGWFQEFLQRKENM